MTFVEKLLWAVSQAHSILSRIFETTILQRIRPAAKILIVADRDLATTQTAAHLLWPEQSRCQVIVILSGSILRSLV